MATFQVLAGSFQPGPADMTATELHVRRLSAKTAPVPTTVPLSAVASVEIAAHGCRTVIPPSRIAASRINRPRDSPPIP